RNIVVVELYLRRSIGAVGDRVAPGDLAHASVVASPTGLATSADPDGKSVCQLPDLFLRTSTSAV
ncbi:jg22395, partial [Pararge aegeria aegeria]